MVETGKLKRVMTLATVFCVCLASSHAYACRCKWSTTEEMYRDVDVVFFGIIVDVSIVNERTISRKNGISMMAGDRKEVIVDVIESWKGGVAGKVIVATGFDLAACGVYFEEDESFMIFANLAEPKEKSTKGKTNGKKTQPITYSTNVCMNTKKWTNSEEDLKVVERLRQLQAKDIGPGDRKPNQPSTP